MKLVYYLLLFGIVVYQKYYRSCRSEIGQHHIVVQVVVGLLFVILVYLLCRKKNVILILVNIFKTVYSALVKVQPCKDENGNDLEQGYVIARALDEITSMKVLSRIEGDDTKVSDELLDNLSKAIEDGLKTVSGEENTVKSISLAKLKEMKAKLVSGYTSFWS